MVGINGRRFTAKYTLGCGVFAYACFLIKNLPHGRVWFFTQKSLQSVLYVTQWLSSFYMQSIQLPGSVYST